jgi:hypothetical protein
LPAHLPDSALGGVHHALGVAEPFQQCRRAEPVVGLGVRGENGRQATIPSPFGSRRSVFLGTPSETRTSYESSGISTSPEAGIGTSTFLAPGPVAHRVDTMGGNRCPFLRGGSGSPRAESRSGHLEQDFSAAMELLDGRVDVIEVEYGGRRDEGGSAGHQGRGLAADDQEIVQVQRREFDCDFDLVGTRIRRLGEIDDSHDFVRISEPGDLDGAHSDSR